MTQNGDKMPEKKDAFQRWLPVGLAIAGVVIVVVVSFEIFALVRVFS